MLMQLVNRFVSFTKTKKFSNIIIICLILLAVEIVRISIIMPFLNFCVIDPTDYQGIEYYEDETYLKFEKGEGFIKSFNSYDFAEECKITDFYYINNWTKDNFIYGKMSDIYIIDFDAGENYEEIREFITTEGSQCIAVNEYETYLLSSGFEKKNDYFFFAFDDGTQNMRYVLVTEIKGSRKEENLKTIGRVIYMNSLYEW